LKQTYAHTKHLTVITLLQKPFLQILYGKCLNFLKLLSGGASQVPGGTTGSATHLLTKLTFKKTVSRDKYFCLKAYTVKMLLWYDI
jgi:hypothetical protein